MKNLIMTTWLFLLPYFAPTVESTAFQVVYRERVLGELTASKTKLGKQDIYLNNTLIRTRLIRHIEVLYKTRVVFQDGILQEADVTVTLDGNPYSRTLTKKSGAGYQFFEDGKLKRTLNQPITSSAIMLLFDEPTGLSSTYSEEAGAFYDIESEGAGVYHKINSKGRKTIYHYKSQDLQRIDIDAGIVDFDMIRKP